MTLLEMDKAKWTRWTDRDGTLGTLGYMIYIYDIHDIHDIHSCIHIGIHCATCVKDCSLYYCTFCCAVYVLKLLRITKKMERPMTPKP